MSDNLPTGTLAGVPQFVRVVHQGKCMILDENRTSIWTPADGSLLIPDFTTAKQIVRDHGYECDDSVSVEQNLFYVRKYVPDEGEDTPEPDIGPLVITAGISHAEALTDDTAINALTAVAKLPDPEFPPGLEYPVRMLAAALSEYVPHPLHVSLAVWEWLRKQEGLVRPALFPDDYAPPLSPKPKVPPKARPKAKTTPRKR